MLPFAHVHRCPVSRTNIPWPHGHINTLYLRTCTILFNTGFWSSLDRKPLVLCWLCLSGSDACSESIPVGIEFSVENFLHLVPLYSSRVMMSNLTAQITWAVLKNRFPSWEGRNHAFWAQSRAFGITCLLRPKCASHNPQAKKRDRQSELYTTRRDEGSAPAKKA